MFVGATCPQMHANFMYTKKIPAQADGAEDRSARSRAERLRQNVRLEQELQLSLQQEADECRAAAAAVDAELESMQEELETLRASLSQGMAAGFEPATATDSSASPDMAALEARLAALLAAPPAPPAVAAAETTEPAAAAAASPSKVARVAEAYDWLSSHGLSDSDIREIEEHFANQYVAFDIKALRGVGIDELRACLHRDRDRQRQTKTERERETSPDMPSPGSSTDSQPSASPSRMSKEGWLLKAGGWNTAWKRRWFVLDGDSRILRYYARRTDTHPRSRRANEPKGSVDLRGLSQADLNACASPMEIKLATPKRVFHFKAESAETAQAWSCALRSCLREMAAAAASAEDQGMIEMDSVRWPSYSTAEAATGGKEEDAQRAAMEARVRRVDRLGPEPVRDRDRDRDGMPEPEPELEPEPEPESSRFTGKGPVPEIVALSLRAEQMVVCTLQALFDVSPAEGSPPVELGARLKRWQRIATAKTTPAEAGAFFPRREITDGVAETPAHSVLGYAARLTQDLCTLLSSPSQGSALEGSSLSVVVGLRDQLDELEAQAVRRGISKRTAEAGGASVHALQIIHHVVTKQVISPARSLLRSCLLETSTLPVQGSEIDGGRFALAIRNLRAQGRAAFQQESAFFSADSDFVPSPSSWRAAVLALKRLRFVFLPAEILATLLTVVRALNDTYKAEALGTGRQGGMSLDQLLPVVVYVIVAAHSDSDGNLQLLPLGRNGRYGSELTVRCEMLRWFGDPRVLNSEGGYYFTVFCSAINVVASQLGQQSAT